MDNFVTPGDTLTTLDDIATIVVVPPMYGDLGHGNLYFSRKLNTDAWTTASDIQKTNALFQATQLIDRLNFNGQKATTSQYLQFPRQMLIESGDISVFGVVDAVSFTSVVDTVVPQEIEYATYELASALLDGKDPNFERDNVAVTQTNYGPTMTQYNRTFVPAHIAAGIPSYTAWMYLKPFLRDPFSLRIQRKS